MSDRHVSIGMTPTEDTTRIPMYLDVSRIVEAVSPHVTLTQTDDGVVITVEDIDGAKTATVYNGPEGPKGDKGDRGEPAPRLSDRVAPLNGSALSVDNTVDVDGVPEYVADVSEYSDYGITDPGWYVFARITAKDGVSVTAQTTVTGADGYIMTVGGDHIDVAVRFEVAAMAKRVTVTWGGEDETFVFRATDLAVRNLDYRTTFYLFDLSAFVTWSYALTTDATFVTGKHYFTLVDGEYVEAVEGVDWTAGDAVPADTYYKHSKLHIEGMTRNVTYKLDEIVDCPIEIALPVVADDGYGAWYEFQLRYDGSYSCTLLPPEGVKIGTVSTQNQTAGINVIDLQYTGVGGVQMWSLLNTHSNIPA